MCWCWWCCVLIVCLYLKWYFYLGLSQLPARRPAKNYQAHKNKCARATGHQPAPGAGGGYITVCSRHLLQQQQHSSQGLRACTCSITITLTIVLWLGYVYGNRDLMCGCSSASHVSCIPQQSRPGWGPLSHSNGCNLIHNHGFTHIIAITSLASHCSDVRCPQLPRKCRYLVLPHRLTLYTAAGGGGKYSEPCFCSNLTFEWLLVLVPAGMSCIALSLRGAITRGWKLDILGTSWAAPPPLHCAAGAGGANSPTYRYLSVKDAKENTLAGPGRVAVPQPPVNL